MKTGIIAAVLLTLVGCNGGGGGGSSSGETPTDGGGTGGSIPDPVAQCPTGYIKVPKGATGLVLEDFCVMKYEAKNDGLNNISVTPSHSPWASISASSAKSVCKAIGTDYDLISNDEWMVIALNIESNVQNWTGGTLYGGSLYKGHSDFSPSAAQAISDTTNYYNNTGSTSGVQRRVHVLDNSEIIWDFSGNLREIVDYGTASTYTSPPYCGTNLPYGYYRQLSVVASQCSNWSDTTRFSPANLITNNTSLNYGAFYADNLPNTVLLRGGTYPNPSAYTQVGVFDIQLMGSNTTSAPGDIYSGFRCVFRGL